MNIRIAYCKNCGKQYENLMDMYGEKCECGSDLEAAMKTITNDYTCVYPLGHNITKCFEEKEEIK